MQNSTYVFFLGSHPELSTAEIWRVLENIGAQPKLLDYSARYLVIATATVLTPNIFQKLGGADRVGQLVAHGPAMLSAADLEPLVAGNAEKKITLGISSIGVNPKDGFEMAKDLKKRVRAKGGSLRFVLADHGGRLNAATVIFNKLTHEPNLELTIIRHGATYYFTRTIFVQDIQAYEQRDTARPARDARIGMLPPKVAQIMLNIATSEIAAPAPLRIWDPFCGMGAILQEGWLMGHHLTGSDVSQDMVSATVQNLAWLTRYFQLNALLSPETFVCDATHALPENLHGHFDAIVTEPFLGKPLSSPLPPAELKLHVDNLAHFYLTALKNLHGSLKPNGILLFLLPAFRNGVKEPSWTTLSAAFLDAVSAIGYSKLHLLPKSLNDVFLETARGTLIYARPDALVGRELTLWQKV